MSLLLASLGAGLVVPLGGGRAAQQWAVGAREPLLPRMLSESAEELASISEDAEAIFNIIDVNGDGEISKNELVRHLGNSGYSIPAVKNIFSKLDVNEDGKLSQDELREGLIKFAPLRSAPGMGNFNADFVQEIHADADALFNSIDADGNGIITSEELRLHLRQFTKYTDEAAARLFVTLDTNTDGGISKEELRAGFVRFSALRQAIGSGPNFK